MLNTINNVGQYRTRNWDKRNVAGITQIVVHHSAYRFDGQEDKSRLKNLMGFHTNQGWAGLSYHYVITKSGQIYQINDHDDLTWTDFDNLPSLSILVDGYFHDNKDKPTKEQLQSLQLLLNDLSLNHPEFPAGQSNVLAHREVHATQKNGGTACCGDDLFPFVVEFRNTGNITIPADPIPEPQPIIENKMVQLETISEIEKSFLETLKKKTDYITELEKTIQLYQMQNQPVKMPLINSQTDGVNVKSDVLPTIKSKPFNFGDITAKIQSGHFLEMILSILFGLIAYANSIGFNPANYNDVHSLINGALTLVAAYFGFRSDLVRGGFQK